MKWGTYKDEKCTVLNEKYNVRILTEKDAQLHFNKCINHKERSGSYFFHCYDTGLSENWYQKDDCTYLLGSKLTNFD